MVLILTCVLSLVGVRQRQSNRMTSVTICLIYRILDYTSLIYTRFVVPQYR